MHAHMREQARAHTVALKHTGTRPQFNASTGELVWRPPCVPLPADGQYLYQGPHELDSYALCLVAHAPSSTPAAPIASAPRCLFLRVLRCTRPDLDLLIAVGQDAAPLMTLPPALAVSFPEHPTAIVRYGVPERAWQRSVRLTVRMRGMHARIGIAQPV